MEHTWANLVRLLTPFRFGSLLLSLGVTGETQVAEAMEKSKVRRTTKPRSDFDLKAATADISKRFSETLKYLAR